MIHNKEYKVSKQFVDFVIHKSGGSLTSDELDEFFEKIEKEANKFHFIESSESNLIRIIGSIYDTTTFLKECLKYPLHTVVITAVAANSSYLTDIAVRNPHYLYLIFNPSFLSKELTFDEINQEIQTGLANYKSFNSKLNFLKLLKRRYFLKVGISDILGEFDLPEITFQLSILSNAITARLFELSFSEIARKYGFPDSKTNYCLCSLGKLGGQELNYSSDIDLILFYDETKTNPVEYQEIITKAAELFIKSSGEMTEKGYLYRVDFRLRPEGKNSPICGTFGDYIRYYESRGEDWERQMLTKLNFTAGDKELFHKFEDYIEHYVYPASFSSSPVEQIRRIKEQIEKKLKKDSNIKLSGGGIRDIEFSVEALQLINGGKIQELREVNTLEAIRKLKAYNLLSKEETDTLCEAYVFYRKIEHYLQLMNDTQTHEIPENPETEQKLARYLGFNKKEEFERNLQGKKERIKSIYQSIVNVEDTKANVDSNFDKIIFQNKNRAVKNLQFLGNGSGLLEQKAFDTKTIRLFKEIEPDLLGYLAECVAPDKVLENFVKVVKKIKLVSIVYQELTNPAFFKRFLYLCEYSDKAINLIELEKTNLELLITRKAFQKDVNTLYGDIGLRNMLFVLSLQFTMGLITYTDVSKHLSNFLSYLIDREFTSYDLGADFFIGALGSFGAGEMNFGSDVDIILVFDEIKDYEKTQKQCIKLHSELNEKIRPFQLDLRLRPEGKSSQLAWDIEKYEEYLSERAEIWEFQALTKLRYLSGSKKLYERFFNAYLKNCEKINQDKLRTSMLEMLKKIRQQKLNTLTSSIDLKRSRGGLTDLEFLSQYLTLSLKSEEIKTIIGQDSVAVLQNFEKKKYELKYIIYSYRLLKHYELVNQNLFDTKKKQLPNDKTQQKLLAGYLGFDGYEGIGKKLKQIFKSNGELFDKLMKE